MSYSGVEVALLDYVADVLVNVCGQDAPDRTLRYQGHLPNDCCSPAGTLSISWDTMYPSVDFPVNAGNRANPCSQFPVVPMSMRWVRCWPMPDVSSDGVTLIDDTWDPAAAELLDVAHCVTRYLMRLMCGNPAADEITTAALADLTDEGMRFFMWKGTDPILPQGGCAGVLWHTAVTITSEAPGS